MSQSHEPGIFLTRGKQIGIEFQFIDTSGDLKRVAYHLDDEQALSLSMALSTEVGARMGARRMEAVASEDANFLSAIGVSPQ